MPCYHPVALPNRVQGTTFVAAGEVPCGQCIGCRLERSRQWAVRMMHEASLHEHNWFLTLTYNDEHLPAGRSLDRRAFPLFMKRLRKQIAGVRYFHCGEYGEDLGRPHYHAALFNCKVDTVPWALRNGRPSWRSEVIENAWSVDGERIGNAELGVLNFESAAYIARYVTKKVTGRKAGDHYQGREPEYATMSRRPGIGRGWFEQFANEVFPIDEVISRGHPAPPPRYYAKLLEAEEPEVAEFVSEDRKRRRCRCDFCVADEKRPRLQVREVCANARLSLLPRRLEE